MFFTKTSSFANEEEDKIYKHLMVVVVVVVVVVEIMEVVMIHLKMLLGHSHTVRCRWDSNLAAPHTIEGLLQESLLS